MYDAVGMPTSPISSFAYAFDPSMRAAAADGPKARMPAAPSMSTSPSTSGASGPTITRSTPRDRAAATIPLTFPTLMPSPSNPSRAMPGLPGVARTSGACGLRASARASACSRPPEPTTRTRGTSECRDELVDRDRRERLVAGRAARPELHRYARHGGLVRRLDDVHEVVLPERRPLCLDRGAQRLDLLVDLLDPARVVLHGLHALGRELGQHDVGRHSGLLSRRLSDSLYESTP